MAGKIEHTVELASVPADTNEEFWVERGAPLCLRYAHIKTTLATLFGNCVFKTLFAAISSEHYWLTSPEQSVNLHSKLKSGDIITSKAQTAEGVRWKKRRREEREGRGN